MKQTFEQRFPGGLAFPNVTTNGSDGDAGMSMLDYFAGQALQGICSHHDTWGLPGTAIASAAYDMAEAMLEARKNRGGAA